MLLAALLAFSVNWVVHEYWVVPEGNWLLLAIKTLCVFILCMVTYTAFAAAFKIEYVGELIARIRNYIKQKFVR